MRIHFVNRFFHPDASATSRVLTDLALALQEDFDVTVVASRQLHDDPNAPLTATEQLGKVTIRRLWSTRFGRRGRLLRALDYGSFHLSVCWHLLRHIRRGNVVVLKTDPPLLQLLNSAVVRLKGGTLVNWLHDLYPEIASRLGLFPGPAWLAAGLATWRDRTLRAARANVVISARMAAYLAGRRVNNTQVIANWADERAIVPVPHEDNRMRRERGLDGRFVVMYSGNLGRVHAFDEIATALELLRTEPGIVFLFVGAGASLNSMKAFVSSRKLDNVQFLPLQPPESLSDSLGAADLHLVSLKAGMEDLVMPSKLYGILAAGRPVAFVGEADGDLARLIAREQVGFAVAHGDGAALAADIRRLVGDRTLQQQLNRNARRLFESEFTSEKRFEAWRILLESLGRAS